MQDAMNKNQKVEDSIVESGTVSNKRGGITESYDTDTFEDASQSHSAAKNGGLQYWKKGDAMESSVSQSKEMMNPNKMNEYMKAKAGGA
jgi:hypothetical protein